MEKSDFEIKYLGMRFVAVAGLEPATSPRMGRFNHLSFTAGKYNTDLLAPPSRIAALFHRCCNRCKFLSNLTSVAAGKTTLTSFGTGRRLLVSPAYPRLGVDILLCSNMSKNSLLSLSWKVQESNLLLIRGLPYLPNCTIVFGFFLP